MLEMLEKILGDLPRDYPVPVIVAAHLHPSDDGGLAKYLDHHALIRVKEAMDKEPILQGHVYIAPSNYHLLVEHDRTLALNMDEKVNFARPSIDVLFESAAFVYQERLVGILLTGASHDGAQGIRVIKSYGGRTIAQAPATSKYPAMPLAALNTGCVDALLSETTMTDILDLR